MGMNFSQDTVRKMAELARLQLTEQEVETFTAQVGKVLTYIDKLGELDTTNVEPLTHALELITPTRAADEARPSPGSAAMLASAPEQLHDSYKVPQVLGGGS